MHNWNNFKRVQFGRKLNLGIKLEYRSEAIWCNLLIPSIALVAGKKIEESNRRSKQQRLLENRIARSIEREKMGDHVEADNAEAIITRIEHKSRKIESLLKQ